MPLPSDADARKRIPIFLGFRKYFPDAIAAAAQLSFIGNKQHNPGQPVHWDKEKSTDHLDCADRHMTDYAGDAEHRDPDGVHPLVKAFWRLGAELQTLHDNGVNIYAEIPDDPVSDD